MWFFVTESLLAFTIFRDEIDIPLAAMFCFLLFIESFHGFCQTGSNGYLRPLCPPGDLSYSPSPDESDAISWPNNHKNASPDHSLWLDLSLSTGMRDSIFRENHSRCLRRRVLGSRRWDCSSEHQWRVRFGRNIRGSIRTPPKTKKVAEPVVQLHDSSPLESPNTSLDSRPSPPARHPMNILPPPIIHAFLLPTRLPPPSFPAQAIRSHPLHSA
jgi:hypothetical protein